MGHILLLDLGNVKVVRNLIYYPSSRSKSAQNVDLEKGFPPFWGFRTKTFLVTHGFRCSLFFVSPKISEQQGPPVLVSECMIGEEFFLDLSQFIN